jgi:O-Antigen ligase
MSHTATIATLPDVLAAQPPAEATKQSVGLPLSALLLLAALTAGTRAQGGFYPSGQLLIGVLLAGAGCATLLQRRSRGVLTTGRIVVPAVFALAFAFWVITSAIAAHRPRAAFPGVALLAASMVTVLIVVRLRCVQRLVVADAVIVIGIAAGVSGFVGVAAHVAPLAHVDQNLWRAATTLTYANAAAGFLVPLALLSLARTAESRAARELMLRTTATTALFIGAASTLSRGGVLAFAVGLVVLAIFGNRRAIARSLVGPAIGCCVALAGLLPSVPGASLAHPIIAGLAFVVGVGAACAVAVGIRRASGGSRKTAALVGGAVLIAVAILTMSAALRHAAIDVAQPRVTTASSDRAGESSAALHEVSRHPLLGVGPGTQTLQWTSSDGTVSFDRYAHDEYLQVAWKCGLVGLALLGALLFSFARCAIRGRRTPATPALWAGAVAGLCSLVTASCLDFLWHLPLIPLTGMVLIGLATTTEEHNS